MAIQVMVEVWEHSMAEGTALLVMLALADRARAEDGVCWPGVEDVAKKARVERRQTINLLAALQETGELRLVRQGGKGPHDTNVYQVAVGSYVNREPQNIPRRKGATERTLSPDKGAIEGAKGATQYQKRVHPSAPEPTDEPLHRTGGAHAQNGNLSPAEVSERLRSLSHADRLRLTAKIETDYGHVLRHVDDRTRKQMIETYLRAALAKEGGE